MALEITNIDSWKDWIVRGISAVKIRFANDKMYYFGTLDDSSAFVISTIDDDNDVGGKSPVAIKIEGSINVIQNNFRNYKSLFKDMTTQEVVGLWIELRDPQGANWFRFNGTPSAEAPERELKVETYNITHHELAIRVPSPTLKINIVGYLSLEVYDTYLDDFFVEETIPTVATDDISEITSTTATCGGIISDGGGSKVTARGVCWSLNEEPTTADSKTTDGTGEGAFESEITGLTANTKYYIRAYATNSTGTAYGEEKSFTTEI